jgi:hypothetical protein
MGCMLSDIVGQKFGKLTVISQAKNRKKYQTYWNCKCDCGKETITTRQSLIGGNTRSCGCLTRERSENQIIDLTGRKIGKLTVLERDFDNLTSGLIHWKCLCDCGNIKSIAGYSLRGKSTKSCGCLQKEIAKLQQIPDGGAAKNKLYGQYKNKANKRGYSFKLSKEEFIKTTGQKCHYCGIESSLHYQWN